MILRFMFIEIFILYFCGFLDGESQYIKNECFKVNQFRFLFIQTGQCHRNTNNDITTQRPAHTPHNRNYKSVEDEPSTGGHMAVQRWHFIVRSKVELQHAWNRGSSLELWTTWPIRQEALDVMSRPKGSQKRFKTKQTKQLNWMADGWSPYRRNGASSASSTGGKEWALWSRVRNLNILSLTWILWSAWMSKNEENGR